MTEKTNLFCLLYFLLAKENTQIKALTLPLIYKYAWGRKIFPGKQGRIAEKSAIREE